MYENYMDYTDDRCMNVFTLCQRERMRAALLNGKRRKELLSSDACTPIMEPPTAELGSNNQQGCPGLIVRFTDLSSNRPNGWEWSFPGGTPATSQEANPVVVYNEIGTYDVQLISQNAYGADTLLLQDYIEIRRGTETTVFYKGGF
jgi:PKD repeat protein